MTEAAAIVLVGGASRRMGADKATLVVDGARMVDRLLAEVAAAGVACRLVAGPDPGDLPPDVLVAPDADRAQLGPLAGVSAAWQALEAQSAVHDPILVLSCDLPRVDRRVIAELIRAADREPVGAAAHDGERLQPLVAVYRRRTVEALSEAFAAGERSIRAALGTDRLAEVRFDQGEVDDADTPDDLAGHDVSWANRS